MNKIFSGQPAQGAIHACVLVSLAVFQSPTKPLLYAPCKSGPVDQNSTCFKYENKQSLFHTFSPCLQYVKQLSNNSLTRTRVELSQSINLKILFNQNPQVWFITKTRVHHRIFSFLNMSVFCLKTNLCYNHVLTWIRIQNEDPSFPIQTGQTVMPVI